MAKSEEHIIQKAVCEYLEAKKINFFAVPNGGARHIAVARKLKEEGVKAGVADLVLLFPEGKIIFVEMKTKKGTQQDSQKDFQKRVEDLGFKYLIWRSVDDAISFISKIGGKI